MKNFLKEPGEFYIGYLPEAPSKTANIIRRALTGLGFTTVIVVLILVLNQRNFPNSQFEYGVTSQLEGFLFSDPIPHLQLPSDSGTTDPAIVLLVSPGKWGAKKTIDQYEAKMGKLQGKKVTLHGYRIYNEHKMLFELNASVMPAIKSDAPMPLQDKIRGTKVIGVEGEIVDPKCYFGVMKPGEGKPHRSCAIRCISGGIPPVMHSHNDYYVVIGEDFLPVNEEILPWVGDQLNLEGKVQQLGNWKLLLINRHALQEKARLTNVKNFALPLEKDITICSSKNMLTHN